MQAAAEAGVVDAVVHVAFLGFGCCAFKPGLGFLETAHARQAVADLMQASAQAGMVDAAVHVAFLFLAAARSNQGWASWKRPVPDRQ